MWINCVFAYECDEWLYRRSLKKKEITIFLEFFKIFVDHNNRSNLFTYYGDKLSSPIASMRIVCYRIRFKISIFYLYCVPCVTVYKDTNKLTCVRMFLVNIVVIFLGVVVVCRISIRERKRQNDRKFIICIIRS